MIATGEATYDEVFVTKPPHVRHLLQLRGTEEGRNVFGNDVWCKAALAWMQVLHDTSGVKKFVVPDVRFPNEVDYIRNNGGRVFRIESPSRVNNSNLSDAAKAHISETALDHLSPSDFDGVIQNDPEFATTLSYQVTRLLHNAP
jgi:hypothetical protein